MNSQIDDTWVKIIANILEMTDMSLQQRLSIKGVSAILGAELQLESCEFQLEDCPFKSIPFQMKEKGNTIMILKIKEKIGLFNWMMEHSEVVEKGFLNVYDLYFLESIKQPKQNCDFECERSNFSFIEQSEQKSEYSSYNQHPYSNNGEEQNTFLEFALSKTCKEGEFDCSSIVKFLQLSRVFQNTYFLSFVHFDSKWSKNLSLHEQIRVNDVKESHQSSLFDKMIENNFCFEQCSFLAEQTHCGILSIQEKVKGVSEYFNFEVDPNVVSYQFQFNQEYFLDVYVGFAEKNENTDRKESGIRIQFFENNLPYLLEKDSSEAITKVVDLIIESFKKTNPSAQFTKKYIYEIFGVEKILKKRKSGSVNSVSFNIVILFHLQKQQCLSETLDCFEYEMNFQSEDFFQELVQISSSPCFIEQIKGILEEVTSGFQLDGILSKDIPQVVQLMADISHLLGESFKEEESNLVTQSLSKIFLLNRL